MKLVVDKVRDRGNIANHELPASTEVGCRGRTGALGPEGKQDPAA